MALMTHASSLATVSRRSAIATALTAALLIFPAAGCGGDSGTSAPAPAPRGFSAARAFADLRAQVALGLIRKVRPEFVADLFGAPPLTQQRGDDTMKLPVAHHASRPHRPQSPLSAQPLRGGG